ncbi:MAG: AAA family ATPase [Candidatus Latescibacteria bacterium]|nr:AAA family ATPase [Candidatus Latescibacterota bacterium]
MRFERVAIEGFGPITTYEASFEPRRLNLVVGPNEAGKSSLAAAIVSTLFGFSSHEEELWSRPWSGARHRASLTFELGGSRYRIQRDFQSHEVLVDRLKSEGDESESPLFRGAVNPRGRGPELERYEELLRSWFGFTDARLFRESCFVHENALETQISPELRHIISGAVEADYQEIQEALLDRLDTLTREHPFDPRSRKRVDRSIETRKANLELLRGRRTRSEYVLRELKSSLAERSTIDTRIAELQAELDGKTRLGADLETLTRLRDEQRKLLKRAPAIGEELVRGRRARNRLQEIDRKISEHLAYLANAPEEVEPDLVRLSILRAQSSRHQRTAETERKRFDESRAPSLALTIIVGLIAGAAFGFLGYAALHSAAAAAVGGIVGVVSGTLTVRLLGRNAERSRALADAKVRVAEENVRTLKQEIDAIEIRTSPYLQGRTLEIVLADLKQFRQLENERREHAAVVQSLPIPERLEAESREIDEAVNALRSKEKFLIGQTPFLAPLRDDPVLAAEASERLKREMTGLKTKIEAAQEARERIARKPGGAEADAENLEALDEAIEAEEESLRREERQRDALLLALEVLRDSVLAFQEEHVGRLARLTGRTLGHLTRGRYARVSLDADLKAAVSVDGKEDLPVESLSHGARDAFYFALRAALARELAAREPLPLLLDDPTAHFDEERRATLLSYLEDLAEDIQVIVLTHDRRVLNQVRKAHLLTIGSASYAKESDRTIQVRR